MVLEIIISINSYFSNYYCETYFRYYIPIVLLNSIYYLVVPLILTTPITSGHNDDDRRIYSLQVNIL